jgi:hypothetical protein
MRTRSVLKGVLAAAALVAATAVPASAAAPAADQGPSTLLLTVTASGPNPSTVVSTAVLNCEPTPSGDHPAAVAACTDLTRAQGDFAALTPTQSFCPMLYLPVTATAVGLWNGQPTQYQQTFYNDCALRRATGNVFAF